MSPIFYHSVNLKVITIINTLTKYKTYEIQLENYLSKL